MLLTALVVLGGYLGLTTLFEMAGPHALVWPRYIIDPSYGIHFGRGRGPFADAVANGFGLYVCALGGVRRGLSMAGRRPGGGVLGGAALLHRHAADAGTLGMDGRRRRHRGHADRIRAPEAIRAAGDRQRRRGRRCSRCSSSPGCRQRSSPARREQEPVWDRQNLTVAALNMISARPLLGFGWDRFQADSGPYFRQSQNYPLTATNIDIHNYFLTYAVELGLIGLLVWLAGLLMGGFGALATRAPPELEPWRMAFLAIAVCFLLVANSVPPTVFQNEAFWLWAGVLWGARRYTWHVRDQRPAAAA